MTKNNIFPPECGRHNSFKHYTVCNPTPEFSDKNLWFQSISVNLNKTRVFQHPVVPHISQDPSCVGLDRFHCRFMLGDKK